MVMMSTDALGQVAQEADEAMEAARARLVAAVRQASREGMSQREIAAAIGRSQPEVSRLIRFHGASPLARKLRKARPEVLRLIEAAGGSNVRVFGSLATGEDGECSDVDLLYTGGRPMGLMALAGLELDVSEAVGEPVDLVPESTLAPFLRDRVLNEAVPL